ncbi:MAG: hypothetical protein LBR32_03795 [Propionibacteriaceae bacterium]|nr:hypothetical protein [Propionibacteriaceae bacterium]
MGFFDRFRKPAPAVEDAVPLPPVPTAASIEQSLDKVARLVDAADVPSAVRSRAMRVVTLVRQTLPRLDNLGLGSYDAYSVMATATDYLPEALGAYLRLPRDWADTRPVQGRKTSLMVLIDQLDLLGATMDGFYDAANRTDAAALLAHGQFLQEKFGHASDHEIQLGAAS